MTYNAKMHPETCTRLIPAVIKRIRDLSFNATLCFNQCTLNYQSDNLIRCTHAGMHARTHELTQAQTHTRTHARMHACMHACKHARFICWITQGIDCFSCYSSSSCRRTPEKSKKQRQRDRWKRAEAESKKAEN